MSKNTTRTGCARSSSHGTAPGTGASARERTTIAALAAMGIFTFTYNWNDFFMGIIYTNRERLHPIQTYLYRLIVASEAR